MGEMTIVKFTRITTVTIAGNLTQLGLTTYLNVLVLFLAYNCASDKIFSRTYLVMCLTAIDFLAVLFVPIYPHRGTVLENSGEWVLGLVVYEIELLVFQVMAYVVNRSLLNSSNAGLKDSATPRKKEIFCHCLSLILSLVLVPVAIPYDATMPLILQSVIRNTQLRSVFFMLDGFVVYYGAKFMEFSEGNGSDMIWNV